MRFRKSVQCSLVGAIVAAQLFSSFGTTLVFASEQSSADIGDKIVTEVQPSDNIEFSNVFEIQDSFYRDEEDLIILEQFIEAYSIHEDNSFVLGEVAFGLSLLSGEFDEKVNLSDLKESKNF